MLRVLDGPYVLDRPADVIEVIPRADVLAVVLTGNRSAGLAAAPGGQRLSAHRNLGGGAGQQSGGGQRRQRRRLVGQQQRYLGTDQGDRVTAGLA